MIDIRKEFPGVLANDGLSMTINSGEALGLLGENGAGKSTFMNILYGLYQPDSGEIKINGQKAVIRSPRDSIALGIGMVHQHFMLVQTHTVAENLVPAMPDSPFFHPTRFIKDKLEEFSLKFGLRINAEAFIRELSSGEQQRVEIVKSLLSGARLLILDEPTSVLTPSEADDLFMILRKMLKAGHSIIFITHKLNEVMKIADNILVLRHGKIAGHTKTSATDKSKLAQMMVGREVNLEMKPSKIQPGRVVLEVNNLVVHGEKKKTAINNLSFFVKEKEILGIAGVSGNGQKELVESLTGLRRPISGTVKIFDVSMNEALPREFFQAGVSHIPEERLKDGVVPDFPLYENGVLKDYFLDPFSRLFFLDYSKINDRAKKIVAEYDVAAPSTTIRIRNLSGGNVQKFIIGRELEGKPNLIVASHPTYGVDIGATELIRRRLLQKREEGCAVLLVSEDLEEILDLSDRIAVIYEGEFMGVFDRGNASSTDIGLMMAGAKRMVV